MILQMYMGNNHCTCSHGMGLYLANISCNRIFGLNGLELKFIIFLVQTGQDQSWGPSGKLVVTNHLISQEQDRVQISN